MEKNRESRKYLDFGRISVPELISSAPNRKSKLMDFFFLKKKKVFASDYQWGEREGKGQNRGRGLRGTNYYA